MIASGMPVLAGLVNHAIGATVTATTAAAGYPAANVLTPRYYNGSGPDTWRSTAITATNLDLDLGSVKSDIRAIILWGTNLSPVATVALLADNNAGFPSPEHARAAVLAFDTDHDGDAAVLDDEPPWGVPVVVLLDDPWSGRYLRIALADSGNTDGYLEVAHVIVGPVLQPGPAEWASGPAWLGQLGTSVSRRGYTMIFRHVDSIMRRRLLSLSRAFQGVGRFFIVPQPGRPATWLAEAMFCRLRIPVQEDPLPGRIWNVTIQTEEVGD